MLDLGRPPVLHLRASRLHHRLHLVLTRHTIIAIAAHGRAALRKGEEHGRSAGAQLGGLSREVLQALQAVDTALPRVLALLLQGFHGLPRPARLCTHAPSPRVSPRPVTARRDAMPRRQRGEMGGGQGVHHL